MNNSYITIIKEERTDLSRKRVPLNQNECTANFRTSVPFEQNLQKYLLSSPILCTSPNKHNNPFILYHSTHLMRHQNVLFYIKSVYFAFESVQILLIILLCTHLDGRPYSDSMGKYWCKKMKTKYRKRGINL